MIRTNFAKGEMVLGDGGEDGEGRREFNGIFSFFRRYVASERPLILTTNQSSKIIKAQIEISPHQIPRWRIVDDFRFKT